MFWNVLVFEDHTIYIINFFNKSIYDFKETVCDFENHYRKTDHSKTSCTNKIKAPTQVLFFEAG